MARSGRRAGEPPATHRAPGRGSKVITGLVALGLAHHVLRSRRFQEGVAVTAIALGALRGIGQENRASMVARLSAWNKRQVQRLERQAERQVRSVKDAGQLARSGPVTTAAGGDAITGKGRRA